METELTYRVRQKNLKIFKLTSNEKYTIFLLKFITKIIFNSKHFNYNIHFLNGVCEVASLVNTLPQAFPEVLHHSLQHVGRNCCHFFPDVLFQIHRCPWFLFVHLALEVSSEEEVLRSGTLVPMNIEVLTKYPLSQDRIVVFFLNTSPQQKPDALQTSPPWQLKCFEFR